ncbi:ImmA/IrrE family metallo-endopeptidase [Persephonella sp.]
MYKELSRRVENRIKALNINKSDLPKEVNNILGKIKQDKYELSYDELKILSEYLYVDPFLLISKSYKGFSIKFRNLSGEYKNDIKSLEKIAYLLIKKGEISKLNFPDYKNEYLELSKSFGDGKENLETGRTLAKKLRKEKEIGNNPVNVFGFAFSNGLIPVIVKNVYFEGLLLLIGNYAFAFIKHNLSIHRMMFSLAHELGHCVMHRSLEISPDYRISFRTKNKEEITANYFASEFILPSDVLLSTKNLNKIANYGLSKEALSYTLEQIGIKTDLSIYEPKKLNYEMDIYPFTGNEIISKLLEKHKIPEGLKRKIERYIY